MRSQVDPDVALTRAGTLDYEHSAVLSADHVADWRSAQNDSGPICLVSVLDLDRRLRPAVTALRYEVVALTIVVGVFHLAPRSNCVQMGVAPWNRVGFSQSLRGTRSHYCDRLPGALRRAGAGCRRHVPAAVLERVRLSRR